MPMPDDETETFPRALVVGEGVYARVLAEVLAADLITDDMLEGGIRLRREFGQTESEVPIWKDVTTAIFCWGTDLSLAHLLWRHLRIWKLIKKWTELKDVHEIACVIAVYDALDDQTQASLRQELIIPALDGTNGYSLWMRSTGLAALLALTQLANKTYFQQWQIRQRGNEGRRVLVDLRRALTGDDKDVMRSAIMAAWRYFEPRQIQLDFYCERPCHPNGHQWRKWLREAVTPPVTPEVMEAGRALLPLISVK